MALLGLVGLQASGGLVSGPLSAYVVHFEVSSECQLLASCHRKQVGPPRVWLNRSLLEYVEFGALGLVSIISPSSELGIERHFFFWIPYSLRKFLKKFENF